MDDAAASLPWPTGSGTVRFEGPLPPRAGCGPVFVIASDESVGRLAPAWADAFARAGWCHRVRVIASSVPSAGEFDRLVAEVTQFGATLVVAAAGDCERQVAAELARMAGLPLACFAADGAA